MSASDDELMHRIHKDLLDSFDEELEMELEDRTVAELTGDGSPDFTLDDKAARQRY
ncbi:MAG TPA: hypothetical protein VN230_00860 [Burkholderiaceae bacterium]|nr:hypothetical protein [Burkholderiaceae bacterium]